MPNMTRRFSLLVAGFLWMTVPGTVARAVVALTFTDGDATPTAGSAAKGTDFSIALNLTSTAEQTTGLDYFLRDNSYVSGTPRFRINDRSITGTYSDPFFADAVVEAQPSSLFDPDNNNNLGASLANVNAPNGAGTFLVANYTIRIDPSTPNGVYTISTFSTAGTGYVGPGPTFTDVPFAAHALYTVTVTPEPSSALLLGGGLLGLLGRRGRNR